MSDILRIGTASSEVLRRGRTARLTNGDATDLLGRNAFAVLIQINLMGEWCLFLTVVDSVG